MDRTGVLQEIRMLRFEEIHDRFTKGRLSAAEAAEWLGAACCTDIVKANQPVKMRVIRI
jgi:hypothetical protein